MRTKRQKHDNYNEIYNSKKQIKNRKRKKEALKDIKARTKNTGKTGIFKTRKDDSTKKYWENGWR